MNAVQAHARWIAVTLAGVLTVASALGQPADAVRPGIAAPLKVAQELLRAGKPQDALVKVREADAVANPSAGERLLLDRMRGALAVRLQDDATIVRSFEPVIASGLLSPAEALPVLEALAGVAMRAQDPTRALQWAEHYFREGGQAEAMRDLKVAAHYLSGDHAGVVRELQPRLQAANAGGTLPDARALRMLAVSHHRLGDAAGYTAALEGLLLRQPTRDQWVDRLDRLQMDVDFPDRLLLDLYRLRLETAALDGASQAVEMAQLALRAGLPAEARRVLETAFASGLLGQGAEGDAHRRLRDTAARLATEDELSPVPGAGGAQAEALARAGRWLVASGRVDKGIELLQQALEKGGLKWPDETRLHLGQAYAAAGKRTQALEAFRAVRAGDDAADLARLWSIHMRRP